jgi:hypothetical protein
MLCSILRFENIIKKDNLGGNLEQAGSVKFDDKFY